MLISKQLDLLGALSAVRRIVASEDIRGGHGVHFVPHAEER